MSSLQAKSYKFFWQKGFFDYYCNNKGRNHEYLLRVNDDIDDIYEEFFLMSELVAVVYESNNFNSTIKTYDTVVIKYFPVGNIYFPINNNWINLVRNFLILSWKLYLAWFVKKNALLALIDQEPLELKLLVVGIILIIHTM